MARSALSSGDDRGTRQTQQAYWMQGKGSVVCNLKNDLVRTGRMKTQAAAFFKGSKGVLHEWEWKLEKH
ncbi:unnamed protein product [Calypogeia fissa]